MRLKTTGEPPRERGTFQGVLTIVRFNWPYYLVALLALAALAVGFWRLESPLLKLACGLATAGPLYFLIGSLGVSHLIYDRSDLYRWRWLERALAGSGRDRMVFCHAGFDEASRDLQNRTGAASWLVLDHFDARQMTEASIRRARKLFPPLPGTLACRYDQWPVPTGSADVIFGILAIHELRSENERVAWFGEARRCLKPDGRVVLVEHTRDFANLLAFGPGFLHFHSRAGWRRCWKRAGLHESDAFRVTPWIRVFVLTPS